LYRGDSVSPCLSVHLSVTRAYNQLEIGKLYKIQFKFIGDTNNWHGTFTVLVTESGAAM